MDKSCRQTNRQIGTETNKTVESREGKTLKIKKNPQCGIIKEGVSFWSILNRGIYCAFWSPPPPPPNPYEILLKLGRAGRRTLIDAILMPFNSFFVHFSPVFLSPKIYFFFPTVHCSIFIIKLRLFCWRIDHTKVFRQQKLFLSTQY